jgi:hypothetical protein
MKREICRGEGEGLTRRRGGIKERGFLKGGGGGLKGIGLKSVSRRIHKKYGIIAENFFLFPLLFYRRFTILLVCCAVNICTRLSRPFLQCITTTSSPPSPGSKQGQKSDGVSAQCVQ